MAQVILARPADSPGYTTLTFDEPIGATTAGVEVVCETPDGDATILVCGQSRFDVRADATLVTFPGGTWKPAAKKG